MKGCAKMSSIKKSILETIGNTPLVEISNRLNKSGARVLAKVEFFNPAGSVKDRAALAMVEEAEKQSPSHSDMLKIAVKNDGRLIWLKRLRKMVS